MKNKILNILVLIWFFLGPCFWKLDFTKGSIGYYDVLKMAPLGIFHLSIFCILIFISLFYQRWSLFNILLPSFYTLMITLTNFPFLSFRDMYLHAGPVKIILSTGKINLIINEYSGYWPSAFILHGITKIILGCNLIVANYILYIVLLIILVYILYLIGRFFKTLDYSLSWGSPILFLALYANHEFNFNHYARLHLSFILLLLIFFIFMRFSLNNKSAILIKLIIIISISTIHPYQSWYISLFLFLIVISEILFRKKIKQIILPIFAFTFFISWILFNAGASFKEINYWLSLTFSKNFFQPYQQALYVFEKLPFWGFLLRIYYKYSLFSLLVLSFIGTITIIIMKRKKLREISIPIIVLISSLIVSLSFTIFIPIVPMSSIYRVVVYMIFPASFSSIVFINEILKEKRIEILKNKTISRLFILLFIISLFFTTSLLKFEGNYYYGEIVHNAQLSSLSFLFMNNNQPLKITTDFKTAMYSNYFNYNSSNQIIYIQPKKDMNLTEILNLTQNLVDQSDIVVNGVRFLEYASSISEITEFNRYNEEISSTRSIIYCNSYYIIFRNLHSTSK